MLVDCVINYQCWRLILWLYMYLSADDPAGWLEWRLDEKQQLPVNTSAPLLDVYKSVRYRQHAGVAIKVHSAYGLPGLYIDEQISIQTFVVLCSLLLTYNTNVCGFTEGLYTQCFVRVLPGRDAQELPATSEGWGVDEKLITLKHDYNSLQTRPEWLDDPTVSFIVKQFVV